MSGARKKRREKMIVDGTKLELIPNSEGGSKNSYVWIGRDGKCLFTFGRREAKKLKKWCEFLLSKDRT